jgi:hypothetical protein
MADQVFISHNRGDSAAAEQIASRLEGAGQRVWMNTSPIPSPRDLPSEIEIAVRESDIFIALLGPDFPAADFGMYELGFALSEQRSRGGILISVILPGADEKEIPGYLRRFDMIDARPLGTDDVVAAIMDHIVAARATGVHA